MSAGQQCTRSGKGYLRTRSGSPAYFLLRDMMGGDTALGTERDGWMVKKGIVEHVARDV